MRRPASLLTLTAATILASSCMSVAWGQADGELFYTRFGGGENVKKVAYDYDGAGTFTLAPPVTIASTPGADGILFAPDGDLMIGGQGNVVHKVNTETGAFCSTTVDGTASFHLALDPDLTTLWSAGIPGQLAKVMISACPLTPGVLQPLSGDDLNITSIAFDTDGNAFYTSSFSFGNGSFGTIDLVTGLTTRTLSDVPAAHGMAFDSFTGHLMLMGDNHITQIDPASPGVILSDRAVPGLGQSFDQGTTDGNGNMFVADNGGNLFFMDYSASGLVGDAGNFVSLQFLDTTLDDVAPLSGPGADPCRVINFDTDDSGDPIAHGAKVDTEFDGGGAFPIIEGSANGSGLNTAAILNSDTGPAAQDPDLLLGCGNVLILQTDANTSECPPGSGIYCTHNDDEDGGTLSFSWPTSPVMARSIALIDIDSLEGTWSVVLTDGSMNQRTYTVPANWTGDFVTDGPMAGKGTLDLTTLADQDGFGSTATATEDPGFNPDDVSRIEVVLGGSGAVDDLSFCASTTSPRLASALARNGAGVNVVTLSSAGAPVIGTPWAADLDCQSFGNGLASLSIRRRAVSGSMSLFGEQLIAGSLVFSASQTFSGSPSHFALTMPNEPALIGLTVHAQGSCRATAALAPKQLAVQGGLSNALDLTLGF